MATSSGVNVSKRAPLRLARGLIAGGLMLGACAVVGGCDADTSKETEAVKIAGSWFTLEIADEMSERFKGLSDRPFIEPDGGIVFTFPPSQITVQNFVMRDCPVPIDIMYLDGTGRVLACYAMTPEPPRGVGEEKSPEPRSPSNTRYDNRLKKYPSRFPSPLVIEVAGGTIARLGVKEGDKVEFTDLDGLKKRAR